METTTTTQAASADSLITGRDALLAALAGKNVDDLSPTPAAGNRAPAVSDSPGAASDGGDGSGATGSGADRAEGDGASPSQGDKSTERATKTWEEINAEKARLDQDRAAFLAEKAKFEVQAATVRDAAQKAAATAEDYERWAGDWEKEGRTDLANSARIRARELRQEAIATQERAKAAELATKRDNVLREVVQQYPDLRNPTTEMFKEMDAILKGRPALMTYPEGIRDAAEFVNAKLQSGRVKSLEAEVSKLKAELQAKERLLQPSRGGTTAAPAGADFESLPSDERRKRLMAAMQQSESQGGSVFGL